MSDLKIQAVEPDPSATTISNDETINKPSGDTSAPSLEDSAMTGTDNVKTDVKSEENIETKSEGALEAKSETASENKSEEVAEKLENSDRNSSGRGGREVGRGGSGWVDRSAAKRKNNKFDPTAMPETGDAGQIRAQVEFYFSDSNLPSDKFLWERTDGANNVPVPVEIIHNFKRMQRFQPYSAVIEALKSSPALILEGEEGKETIKRKTPYDPQARDNARPRSVYVKGFGEEEPTSQFDIEAFFTNYGATRSVRLRRHEGGEDHGLFKGSVFCEFQDKETADNFLKTVEETKPVWKGNSDLKIMSKDAYIEEKNQLIKDGKMQPAEAKSKFFAGQKFDQNRRGNRNSGDFKRDGDRDDSDWRKRRDDDQRSGFRGNGRGRGRGRGNGGSRGGRDNRDRNNDNRDNRDRAQNATAKEEGASENKTEPTADAGAAPAESNNKRPRDDDTNNGEAPAKKLDTKETST